MNNLETRVKELEQLLERIPGVDEYMSLEQVAEWFNNYHDYLSDVHDALFKNTLPKE